MEPSAAPVLFCLGVPEAERRRSTVSAPVSVSLDTHRASLCHVNPTAAQAGQNENGSARLEVSLLTN